MTDNRTKTTDIPLRSVLYVPATNQKALAKIPQLKCDAVIIDLEDAVALHDKNTARKQAKVFFENDSISSSYKILRINALDTEFAHDDAKMANASKADAVLIPKIAHEKDIDTLAILIKKPIMLMVETPAMISCLTQIISRAKQQNINLIGLVVGTNDLAREMEIRITDERDNISYILQKIVLNAKSAKIPAIDGVFGNFKDDQKLLKQAVHGSNIGYDGKTIIHPNQIATVNEVFTPDKEQIKEAENIVAAFALEQNKGKAVINLNGVMFEELHHQAAKTLLQKMAIIKNKK